MKTKLMSEMGAAAAAAAAMHMSSVCSSSSATTARIININSSRRDQVYVAAVALRATKGPAQLLMSAAYSLNFWDLQHFMVIIKPHDCSSLLSHNQALVCDFQPKDPEDVWVAAAALSGREVPGVILVRQIGRLPRRKCWFVGYSDKSSIDAARKFNKNWDTNLKIGRHDCQTYCEGLVEYLIGKKNVLEQLRESTRYNNLEPEV